MKFLLASLSALALATSATKISEMGDSELQSKFVQYMHTHDKEYPIELVFTRFNTYVKNIKFIEDYNNDENMTAVLEENHTTDLTNEEFAAAYNGYKPTDTEIPMMKEVDEEPINLGDNSIDWRRKGVVTPVKDQAQCGSCWSFSTTGSIESAIAIRTGQLNSLSEQQLVDCSTQNKGCHGGNPGLAMMYVGTSGLTREESYPYTAKDGHCQPFQPSIDTMGLHPNAVPPMRPDVLLQALQIGPVSVGIQADEEAFRFYKSGVLAHGCGTAVDHAVLLVGYGEQNGQQYWTIKNSWGPSWGDLGYIRIGVQGNICGIQTTTNAFPSIHTEFEDA